MGKALQLFGHPLHPVFVHLPMGLLPVSFLGDLMSLWWKDPFWAQFSFYTLSLGLIAAIPTVVTGFLDYTAIPESETQAQKIGSRHMTAILVAVSFFLLSLAVRIIPTLPPEIETGAILAMSGLGMAVLGWAGWLGGELVYRLGVGRNV
jgi:uncharacterized membrane protein